MKDLNEIYAAERLVKNLMWLERSNPLLTIEELLDFGCRISERIKDQRIQVGDNWHNELAPIKTLEAAFRYLLHCEMDVISNTKRAPEAHACERSEHNRERTFTKYRRRNVRDLSMPMALGRAELLGGGPHSICTNA